MTTTDTEQDVTPPPQPLPVRVVVLPAGVWVPEANELPGDTIYEGAGAVTVIQAANPDTDFIAIGPRTTLRNVAIHDAFGMQPIVMHYRPNGPRPVAYLQNAHEVPMASSHWMGTASYISGGVAGVDSPVTAIRAIGAWSACLFCEAHEKTYGLHTWSLADAKGVLVEHFERSTGIHVTAKAGAEPPFGSLTMLPEADVRSLHIQPAVATTADVQLVSAHKVTGSWVAIYHTGSAFNGAILHANMAHEGGSFTGRIFDVHNAGQPVFVVTSGGDIISRQMAEMAGRIAALEAAVEQLLNR